MATVGTYLGQRLQELGISSYFAIPGDYNLTLLDELLKVRTLKMINCCNELNAGYAADGYTRVHGISALVVTFAVGGISAMNAIAGAYAENLPVIVISGGPNTNSIQDAEILHHTLGTEHNDFVQRMYKPITAHTVFIHRPADAPFQIDEALDIAMTTKKPVYIEIACNISHLPVSEPTERAFTPVQVSDTSALNAALKEASEKLNTSEKPVLVAGAGIRAWGGGEILEKLSEATQYALAAMPDAKSFVSETHPNFVGIYWGPVSSPGCSEIVESSDLYLFAGPNFNDYTTVGHMCDISPKKLIRVDKEHVVICGEVYTSVMMKDFLQGLIPLLRPNSVSLESFRRIEGRAPLFNPPNDLNAPLTMRFLFAQIQHLLSSNYAILAETGDSWFNGMRLELPERCPFEIQMQYGSIGWSVGALLGMQAALQTKKRVIGLIGDGSFQMSAQELSTLIRYDFKPIIFLINNGCYGIEVQIHDGPYNAINNWHYSNLVSAFNGKDHGARHFEVKTFQELLDVMEQLPHLDCLCFVEVHVDRNDCNKNLLQWGSKVATYNSRSPR